METYEDEDKKKVKDQAEAVRLSYGQTADAIEAAGQQQIGEMQGAQAAQQQAYNTAQQLYQQRMNEGYNQFADIIAGQKRQMQDEQQQAQQQLEANNRAARWTGLTELAAGIANLVSVGAGNAVSQQYKTYSQDWMQKADRDIREHRSRMDNLRERQRALQLQLNQLKMGDAGTALQNAQRMADQAVRNREALAQLRAQNTTAAAAQRAKGESEAAGIEAQGALQGAHLGLQQSQLGLRYADQKFEQDKYRTQMLANGWVPNPEAPGGFEYNPEKAKQFAGDAIQVPSSVGAAGRERTGSGSSSSSSSGSGGSGNVYDFVVDGVHHNVRLSTESYKTGIQRGKEELKKDILDMAGFDGTWDEFADAATTKLRGREKREARKAGTLDQYQDYQQIIDALNGSGDIDADNDVIRDFTERNKASLRNFNTYMIGLTGQEKAPEGATQEEKDPYSAFK